MSLISRDSPPHQTSRRLILQDQGAYLEKTHIEFLTFSRSFFENVLAFFETERERTKGEYGMSDRTQAERAEYERIRALFSSVDENQLALVDGAIWEAARLRTELDGLHAVVAKSGLVKVDPANPSRQKELPVSKLLPKVRAGYTNIIFKLAKVLGATITEDDLGMDDYE